MYDAPPMHGFLPVTVALFAYLALALGFTVASLELGVPVEWGFYVFTAACLALLKPFGPLFRRLSPSTPRGD